MISRDRQTRAKQKRHKNVYLIKYPLYLYRIVKVVCLFEFLIIAFMSPDKRGRMSLIHSNITWLKNTKVPLNIPKVLLSGAAIVTTANLGQSDEARLPLCAVESALTRPNPA